MPTFIFFSIALILIGIVLLNFKPESVNSVMMIMAFIFEQMSCYFEGAMGVYCNREVARQMSQRNPV